MSASQFTLPQYTAYDNTTKYTLDDGTVVFGLLRVPLLPDASDSLFIVDQRTANKLDLISFSVYGTPQLYWAIAALNNIIDLHFGIPIGTRLRIPVQSRIPTI